MGNDAPICAKSFETRLDISNHPLRTAGEDRLRLYSGSISRK